MKFNVGADFEHAGVRYRVLAGDRKDGDMVLQFSLDRGRTWHQPKMAHTFICAEFKFQVEENNYPRSKGFDGGFRFLTYIGRACGEGWEKVAAEVEIEAEEAKERRRAWNEMWSLPFQYPERL